MNMFTDDINMFDGEFDFQKVSINFVNKSNNPNPTYATTGSSGFDIRAFLSEPCVLGVGEIKLIETGLYFELIPSLEIQIRPRSGLALKHGITVLNSPGTLDSDYTGVVKIILINHGSQPFTINNGDRIAQGVICPILGPTQIDLNQIEEITSVTDRSDGGFGSTGLN